MYRALSLLSHKYPEAIDALSEIDSIGGGVSSTEPQLQFPNGLSLLVLEKWSLLSSLFWTLLQTACDKQLA